MVPVSLALKGEQYANELWRYKNAIDDTWATGNHVQSAASALKAAGAGSVAVLVLGRHLNRSYGDTATHVEQARLRRFSWDSCALKNWNHAR